MNKISNKIHSAWRRSEAYMIPMTEEGQRKATERLREFSIGYEYGVKAAAAELERMHSNNKRDHSFFYKASVAIRELLKDGK